MKMKSGIPQFARVAMFNLLASLPLVAQPILTTQPSNQFLAAAKTVAFSVSATGTPPLSYQWLFDGAALPNATNSSIAVTNPVPAQWGYYSVVVSNASGAVTSQVAELKIFTSAPHGFSGIEAQPGGSMSLSFAGETSSLFAPYFDIYPLETSTNLLDWTPLAMLQRTNSYLATLQFLDTNAPEFNHRFYRTPTNQLATPDPAPTGPYPVGTFSMLLTNTLGGSRSNAHFMVTFWYPAVAEAGVLPAKYVEPQVAAGGTYGNFAGEATAFYSHSVSNAPLATHDTPCPIVLYDPGQSGHRRENTDKAEELASWGYVVVGLDTSETAVSVLPDGTVVRGTALSSTITGDIVGIEARLLDLQFLLDELTNLNASDLRLEGLLDLDRIGAIGYSLGGSTVAQLCLRDPRCKAGIGIDGPYLETNLLTQPINVPWLFFRSDVDPDPAGWWFTLPNGRLDDRLQVFNEQVADAYWVKLASTVHGSFGDYDLIADSASLEAGYATPMSGQYLAPARLTQIIRAYSISFFNKFLRGEDDHLLDGPTSAYPEVEQFLSKSASVGPPEYPSAGLVQGSDGNLYGATQYGGRTGAGALFRVTPSGELVSLVSFNGANGSYPHSGLLEGSDGNFYGTTEYGGTDGNHGTVFQLTPAGTLTTLVSFNGTNGSYPLAAMVEGKDGDFYGTTQNGGASGMGTVFKITRTGDLTTLVSFNNSNGAVPLATLVQGIDGNLYGTTFQGGDLSVGGLFGNSGAGTAFKMTPDGMVTTLVVFSGSNGEHPASGLIQGSDGNFYGATEIGGQMNLNAASGYGTVFKMTPAGALTKLVSFGLTNGYNSSAGLVQASDGNLYGTTMGGGAGGGGTVFKMTPNGVLTTLVAFNGANGRCPQAALIRGTDGNFYGTTEFGGPAGAGTVFRMTPDGVLTTLVAFGSSTNSP